MRNENDKSKNVILFFYKNFVKRIMSYKGFKVYLVSLKTHLNGTVILILLEIKWIVGNVVGTE